MTVLDILSKITDGTNVEIWQDNEIIASYDGRNSIPDELNDKPIRSITSGYFVLSIEV